MSQTIQDSLVGVCQQPSNFKNYKGQVTIEEGAEYLQIMIQDRTVFHKDDFNTPRVREAIKLVINHVEAWMNQRVKDMIKTMEQGSWKDGEDLFFKSCPCMTEKAWEILKKELDKQGYDPVASVKQKELVRFPDFKKSNQNSRS